jgi:hypothetical protein
MVVESLLILFGVLLALAYDEALSILDGDGCRR